MQSLDCLTARAPPPPLKITACHFLTDSIERKECPSMETSTMIKAAIFNGTLRPDEAPFAEEILTKHGVKTLAAFLQHRQEEALQTRINKQLRVSDALVAKYNS